MESLVLTVAKNLGIYTNIDSINEFEKEEKKGQMSDEEYKAKFKILDSKVQLYIAHFGMTKGENRYKHCDTAIVIGDYFLPNELYQMQEIYCKRKLTMSDKIRQAAGWAIQELSRSIYREREIAEFYVACDERVFVELEKYFEPYAVSMWHSDYENIKPDSDPYEFKKSLTKQQYEKFHPIIEKYPKLMEHKSIVMTTVEYEQLTGIRSNNVLKRLDTLSKKSGLEYKILNKSSGQHQGTLFELVLR